MYISFTPDCPALVTPAYGSLDTADVKEGTVVTVTCNTGYTLIGDIALECLPGGEWDKFLPVCDRGTTKVLLLVIFIFFKITIRCTHV